MGGIFMLADQEERAELGGGSHVPDAQLGPSCRTGAAGRWKPSRPLSLQAGLWPGRLRTATERRGRDQSCASGRRAIVAK
eukprot:4689231-Alexandrium_andersonii.AAC.1